MNNKARDKAAKIYVDGLDLESHDEYIISLNHFCIGYDAGHAAAWNEIGAYAQQMGLSPEWVGLCREKAGHYLGDEK
jgi:hypothetical protein